MDIQLITSIISALVALFATIFTLFGQFRIKRIEAEIKRAETKENRKYEALRIISRFREPLAHSAFELQSRIFNILLQGLVVAHYTNGTEEEKKYVIRNTAYLIAQFFAWVEIIRRESLFYDLGDINETKNLGKIIDNITNIWLVGELGKSLKIFRGNQRAIGEQMIIETPRGQECIGYSEFYELIKNDSHYFLNKLHVEVKESLEDINPAQKRLILLQSELVKLLDFLDPNKDRFPEDKRLKINEIS